MQSICQKHQKPNSVIDLTIKEVICEHCALFEEEYQKHEFIQGSKLEQHVRDIVDNVQHKIGGLGLYIESEKCQWKLMKDMISESEKEKRESINYLFDRLAASIEQERQEQLTLLDQKIAILNKTYTTTVDSLSHQTYLSICQKKSEIDNMLKSDKYMDILKKVDFEKEKKQCERLEGELKMVEIELRQELDKIKEKKEDQKKEQIVEEESLLQEWDNETFQLDLSRSEISIQDNKSTCKTQISFVSPQSDRLSELSSNTIGPSTSKNSSKATLKISYKSQLSSSLAIKNSIRTIDLSSLSLNNRETISALKLVTSRPNFVSKIDLSNNALTAQIVGLIKREKLQSQYLKTIVIHGMKIDKSILKREGINQGELATGRIKIGELTLIL